MIKIQISKYILLNKNNIKINISKYIWLNNKLLKL